MSFLTFLISFNSILFRFEFFLFNEIDMRMFQYAQAINRKFVIYSSTYTVVGNKSYWKLRLGLKYIF